MASPKDSAPFRPEIITFTIFGIFFATVGAVYMSVAAFEPIGSVGFVMLSAMSFMISGYLWLVARRTPTRWEDKVNAEISEATGEIGVFSPSSWWPLVAGVGVALLFLAVAIGWWILVPGVAIGAIGLVGMVMEFSTGHYAH